MFRSSKDTVKGIATDVMLSWCRGRDLEEQFPGHRRQFDREIIARPRRSLQLTQELLISIVDSEIWHQRADSVGSQPDRSGPVITLLAPQPGKNRYRSVP